MQYRRLGRTQLMVTPISFGALPIQRCDMPESKDIINEVLDCGINFFDTGRVYSDSEEKIGRYASSRRSEFYLATKSMAITKKDMASDIDKSLKSMNVEYIDLYQVHNIKTEAALAKILAEDGALAALKEAKKAGKIGHIGVTGHIMDAVIKAVKTNEFDTVQFPFNYIEQRAMAELFPLAKSMDMGIIVMKPLGGGVINRTDLALRFILEQEGLVAIPGMDKVEQIKLNLAAGKNFKPLTTEEQAILEAEAAALGSNFCRRCGYCLPCEVGIDIPQFFIFHIQYTRYGLKEPTRQRYLNFNGAKAHECIECGKCEERCPYGLPIRNRIKEISSFFD